LAQLGALCLSNLCATKPLLSNLLAILGNKLIEKWMKKSWLKFKPNPNIVEINNIQPVDLIKFYEE